MITAGSGLAPLALYWTAHTHLPPESRSHSLDGGTVTVIVAAISAVAVLAGYLVQQALARRERRARTYSSALQTVADYRELPYLILRRGDAPGDRAKLARRISKIQSRLTYYAALLELAAPRRVSQAYGVLLREVRAEAGSQMSDAWSTRRTRTDPEVPLGARLEQPRSDAALGRVLRSMRR